MELSDVALEFQESLAALSNMTGHSIIIGPKLEVIYLYVNGRHKSLLITYMTYEQAYRHIIHTIQKMEEGLQNEQ